MIIIDGYTVDAAIREMHGREADVTQYEVESGSDITDHVRPRPVSVEIDGLVSDTPIGAIASLRAQATGSSSATGELLFIPSEEARSKLVAIFGGREPVTIQTSSETYESMAIASLSITEDANTGEALRFSATFTQVRIVSVTRTAVRVSAPRGASKAHAGSHAVRSVLAPAVAAADYLSSAIDPFADLGTWDASSRIYRDKDGNALFSDENVFYDPGQQRWVSKDGTPVTQWWRP